MTCSGLLTYSMHSAAPELLTGAAHSLQNPRLSCSGNNQLLPGPTRGYRHWLVSRITLRQIRGFLCHPNATLKSEWFQM